MDGLEETETKGFCLGDEAAVKNDRSYTDTGRKSMIANA